MQYLKKSPTQTVLTKLEELAANRVLREEFNKNQTDMIKSSAATYAIASSFVESSWAEEKVK